MRRNVFRGFCLLWVWLLSLPALASVTYVHTDVLGSPIAETNSSGALVANYHYKPFGETLETKRNDVGYTGHMEDKELGLTYMQQRYYDPVIGRFYSNDPVGFRDVHSFNRYAYANNNPYKFTDPDGRAVLNINGKDMGTVNGSQLLSAINEQPAGSIESISLFNHGTSTSMDLMDGDILYASPVSGNVVVTSGGEISDLGTALAGKMSEDSTVTLSACNVGDGKDSLAATLSKSLPNSSVTGFSTYAVNSGTFDVNVGIAATFENGIQTDSSLMMTEGDLSRVEDK